MADPSTSVHPSPEPDYAQTILEPSPDPESRYDKLYKCILKDDRLGTNEAVLYGVLRGISRKSGTVNAKNSYLVNETGMSLATVKRAMKNLLDRGVVKCRYRTHEHGTDRRCSFPPLSSLYETAQIEPGVAHIEPRPVAHIEPQTISLTREQENSRAYAHAHAREREGEEERSLENGRAPKDSGAHASSVNRGVGVSNSLDSWWTEESATVARKLGIFDHLWSHWPKQSHRQQAMEAFRATFASEFERDADFGNTLWKIVQWQLEQWQKEEREQRYVPTFGNWIARGQWQDAPASLTA